MFESTPLVSSALEFPFAAQIEMINACFVDYPIRSVDMTLDDFGRAISSCSYDLSLSRILLYDQQLIGFVYVGHYEDTTRIASLGVLPEFRRKGFATLLMRQVIQEARQQPSAQVALECLAENTGALCLYEKLGFSAKQTLYGYKGIPRVNSDAASIEVGEPSSFLAAKDIVYHDPLNLPYQLSGYPYLMRPESVRAFRTERSVVLLSVRSEVRTVKIASLMNIDNQLQPLRNLLLSVASRFPDYTWEVAEIVPERLGSEVLEPVGLKRKDAHQIQLELPLTGESNRSL